MTILFASDLSHERACLASKTAYASLISTIKLGSISSSLNAAVTAQEKKNSHSVTLQAMEPSSIGIMRAFVIITPGGACTCT